MMNNAITIIFYEDYFVCSILPNENAWETLKINCSEKNLLYFYLSGSEIRNDSFSKDRFDALDSNAYGEFYELITRNNIKFKKFDLELEPICLLNDLIEQVKFVYYERIISFIPDLDINNEIPLNICFIPGINEVAQKSITSYLLQQGFKLNCNADYFESFLKILYLKGIIGNKINLSIIETCFGDLQFHYIEYNNLITKKESEILIGRGVDHRIGNLAKLMVEKAARQASSSLLNDSLLIEKEIKKIQRRAALEINNFEFKELSVKIELSDYTSARVIIDERELEKMSSETFQYFKFRYEAFISKHSNLARTEKIILEGNVLSSEIFVQFFQKSFGASKVIKPYDNSIELLSRGVFAISPLNQQGLKKVNEELTITITVTANPIIQQNDSNSSLSQTVANRSSMPPPPLPMGNKPNIPPPLPIVNKPSVPPVPPPPPKVSRPSVPPPPRIVSRPSMPPPPPPASKPSVPPSPQTIVKKPSIPPPPPPKK